MFDPPLPVPDDKPFISHLSPVFMGETIRSNVLYTFYAYGLTYPKNGSSHKGDDLNLFYESIFFSECSNTASSDHEEESIA